MEQDDKRHWQERGSEPDYRFSLANERTFLAWIRTALALLAGAILLHQFAHRLQPAWLYELLTFALVVFSAFLSASAYVRWKGNEIAMRHAQPLPRSRLIPFMAAMVAAIAVAVVLVLGVQ